MSVSEPPTTEGPGDEPQPEESGHRSPSVLGLSIVSGLNVISLAFIAYHYVSHPEMPAAAPDDGRTTDDVLLAAPEQPAASAVAASNKVPGDTVLGDAAFGNVDLVSAPKLILEIATGIGITSSEPVDRRSGEPAQRAETVATAAATPAGRQDIAEYWVQLGALSNEATAARYWEDLRQRHEALLQGRKPQIFSPADVGGSLHHLRLGPMDGDAAAGLCRKLEAEGADCFCIRP